MEKFQINVLNGTTSYFYNEGHKNNITLMLLHGGTMSKTSMIPLGNALSDYRLIIPDLSGHGESDAPIYASVESHADFIEAFIEEMYHNSVIVGPLILIGYCLSGSISLEIARRNNPYVSGIVSLAGSARLPLESRIHYALDGKTPETFNYIDVFQTGHPTRLTGLTESQIQITQALEPLTTCFYDLICVTQYNRWNEMYKINIPTLLISGDMDITVPTMSVASLRNEIPTAMLYVIPYTGHALLYKSFDSIVSVIRTFIETGYDYSAQFQSLSL